MKKVSAALSNKIANMSLLCSIMVVCIHVMKRPQIAGSAAWWVRQITGEGVCRIAVPFFFVVSGYFLAGHFCEKGWYRRETFKRLKTLIVPYFVWSLICFLLCSCIIAIQNLAGERIWHSEVFTWRRFVTALGINPFAVPELRQLWFVRALFALVIVAPVLRFGERKLENLFGRGAIAIVWALWAAGKFFAPRYMSPSVSQFLNFGFISFEGISYFMLGMFLQVHHIDILRTDLKTGWGLVLAGLLIVAARWPLCFAIPVMLVGVFLIVPDSPLPKWLQGLHFPLYLVHLNVVFVYFALADGSGLFKRYSSLLDPSVSVVGECICFVCVMIVSCGICFLLKRISLTYSSLGALMFGGRK